MYPLFFKTVFLRKLVRSIFKREILSAAGTFKFNSFSRLFSLKYITRIGDLVVLDA